MSNDMTIYNQCAPNMYTGDMLRYDGDDILDDLIKIWSPGTNHVGLVLRYGPYLSYSLGAPFSLATGDRRWTIEAKAGGVEINLLSPIVEGYKGHIWWYPLKEQYNGLREAMGEFALKQQGKPYDFLGLFTFPFVAPLMNTSRYVCSSLDYAVWQSAGIVPPMLTEPTPAQDVLLPLFNDPIKIV